jgi:heat shock protein HslJ
MARLAARKTAGVLGDDLALNAHQFLEGRVRARLRKPDFFLKLSQMGLIMRCPGSSQLRINAPLVNTHCRIVRLQGDAVRAVTGRCEPHLVLRQSQDSLDYTATIGCNTLMGTFETAADRLLFARPAATRMGCPPPLAEMERRLGEVLPGAPRWQIIGNTLSPKEAAGEDSALLEAVYF